eukprot:scaffold544_cov256-Pinguiococcus_pyrenoidosus.AAC.18
MEAADADEGCLKCRNRQSIGAEQLRKRQLRRSVVRPTLRPPPGLDPSTQPSRSEAHTSFWERLRNGPATGHPRLLGEPRREVEVPGLRTVPVSPARRGNHHVPIGRSPGACLNCRSWRVQGVQLAHARRESTSFNVRGWLAGFAWLAG